MEADKEALTAMAWAIPQFPKGQVDNAGRTLARPNAPWDELLHALEVVNNWRASHSFPLNTFQVRLRLKGREIDPGCLVAQRIKRLSSITYKLKRFDKMLLSRMQDIGGCRAILGAVGLVDELVNDYLKSD